MDKNRKVVITGIGVIAPNGNTKDDFFVQYVMEKQE